MTRNAIPKEVWSVHKLAWSGKTRGCRASYQGTTSVVPMGAFSPAFRADFSPREPYLNSFRNVGGVS